MNMFFSNREVKMKVVIYCFFKATIGVKVIGSNLEMIEDIDVSDSFLQEIFNKDPEIVADANVLRFILDSLCSNVLKKSFLNLTYGSKRQRVNTAAISVINIAPFTERFQHRTIECVFNKKDVKKLESFGWKRVN